MAFTTEASGDVRVVRASGYLDSATAPAFKEALDSLVAEGVTRIVIDLGLRFALHNNAPGKLLLAHLLVKAS